MLKMIARACGALLFLCALSGGPAMAACPYTGNTSGTDSAAILNTLTDMCANSYGPSASYVSGVTAAMTSTTSTSLVAAPAASLRNYITQLVCTNSHATVGTFVLIQDGSGGTTIYEAYAAAVGGGFAITFPTPLRQPTTATALYVADVTTGANVICAASGFKAA